MKLASLERAKEIERLIQAYQACIDDEDRHQYRPYITLLRPLARRKRKRPANPDEGWKHENVMLLPDEMMDKQRDERVAHCKARIAELKKELESL